MSLISPAAYRLRLAVLFGGLSASFLFVLPDNAAASTADCEIVSEGAVLLDGQCEFNTTDSAGSFELSAEGIHASVLVSSEGNGGVAFYENETGRGEAGAWKLGEVTRNGACWGNQYGRICAWAAGTRTSQKQAAPPLPPQSGGKPEKSLMATVGQWNVYAYSSGPNVDRNDYCSALKIIGSELGVYYTFDGTTFGSGFSGYGSAASDGPIDVAIWFDDSPRPTGYPTRMVLQEDGDGFAWRMQFETTADNNSDLHGTKNVVHYAYRVDGKDHVESFPLLGSMDALQVLHDCMY